MPLSQLLHFPVNISLELARSSGHTLRVPCFCSLVFLFRSFIENGISSMPPSNLWKFQISSVKPVVAYILAMFKVVCKAIHASRHYSTIQLRLSLGLRFGSGELSCWQVGLLLLFWDLCLNWLLLKRVLVPERSIICSELDLFNNLHRSVWSRYLEIMKAEGLEISQPALDSSSLDIHHALTRRVASARAHKYELFFPKLFVYDICN